MDIFCHNCGEKTEKFSKFCNNCSTKFEVDASHKKVQTANKKTSTEFETEVLFYSQGWLKTNGFEVATLPYYDILVDKKDLYLIKLPRAVWFATLTILGFILLRIIGLIIGTLVGNALDRSRAKRVRSLWMNSDHQLISEEYRKAIYLKIPKDKVKASIEMKGGKSIRLIYNNQKLILKNKKDRERFRIFLETYI